MSTEQRHKSVLILSLTQDGAKLGRRIYGLRSMEILHRRVMAKKEFVQEAFEEELLFPLKSLLQKEFHQYDFLIMIMATGIAVRVIAPFLRSKVEDPGVLVLDEQGKFVISLLSGHIGGANELTNLLAKELQAQPVVTTASDGQNKWAVDEVAHRYQLVLGSLEGAKKVTVAHVNHKRVGIYDPKEYIKGATSYEEIKDIRKIQEFDGIIHVTYEEKVGLTDQHPCAVKLIPKVIVLGIGFRRDCTFQEMKEKVDKELKEWNMDRRAILRIATIPLKARQEAYKEMVKYYQCESFVCSIEEIQNIEEQFEGSDFVRKTIGIGAVAEPCGYLGSQQGICILKKKKLDGMTLSIWEMRE